MRVRKFNVLMQIWCGLQDRTATFSSEIWSMRMTAGQSPSDTVVTVQDRA